MKLLCEIFPVPLFVSYHIYIICIYVCVVCFLCSVLQLFLLHSPPVSVCCCCVCGPLPAVLQGLSRYDVMDDAGPHHERHFAITHKNHTTPHLKDIIPYSHQTTKPEEGIFMLAILWHHQAWMRFLLRWPKASLGATLIYLGRNTYSSSS